MKKQSRLQFTEEENADPTLEKPIAKAEKAADKVDKAQAKIPKKNIKFKERTFDADTGKTKVRLCFEEVDKPKPPSKLEHGIKKAPQRSVLSAVHKKISEEEQDNVGLKRHTARKRQANLPYIVCRVPTTPTSSSLTVPWQRQRKKYQCRCERPLQEKSEG